jgi:hypothetical protein
MHDENMSHHSQTLEVLMYWVQIDTSGTVCHKLL